MQKRAIGTFPSPNIFAGYLIIAFFLACRAMQISNYKFALFQIAVISFAIILTKSFGAYISLVIALIVLSFLSYNDIKKQKLIAVFCLIAVVLGIAFMISSKWNRLMNLDDPHNSIIQRINYWRISIAAIKDHPLLGIGSGNFQEVFLKYKVGLGVDTRYSHNIFLQTWLETGTLGLISIGFLIIAFIKTSLLKSKYILLAGLAFVLHNLIDITYFIPETGLFWWALLGLTAQSKSDEKPSDSARA
jgi:putative inorganic carbon (HCO3(-)) transporter